MCRSRWCARPFAGADRRYFPGRRPALLSMLKNEQEGKAAATRARRVRVVRILRSHRRCQSSGRRRKGGKRHEMCLPCPTASAVAGVFCRSRPSLMNVCSLCSLSSLSRLAPLPASTLRFEFLGKFPACDVPLVLSPKFTPPGWPCLLQVRLHAMVEIGGMYVSQCPLIISVLPGLTSFHLACGVWRAHP